MKQNSEAKILTKIRLSPSTHMYFDQYYDVTLEQNIELMKLNITQNKHTCRHTLSDLVKKHQIDCSDMKLLQNVISCTFCRLNLRELRYIETIKVDSNNIPLSTCSFPVEMLIYVSKEEEELSKYNIKISNIIKQKEQEKQEEMKDSNMYQIKCCNLRQGQYVMIQDHPCKLVYMTTSKD